MDWKRIVVKIKNLPKRIYREYESSRYRKGKYSDTINVMNAQETLEYLNKNVVSFCRFGDGEIAIMNGESIAFQSHDTDLAKKLKEILVTDEAGLVVGINYFYLNPVENVNRYTMNFLNAMANQRKFLINNCNKSMVYMDAAITQMYQNYQEYDFDAHFRKLQSLFTDKDITLVCGANVLENIEYNALDVCKSIEYIYAPSKNAYAEYPKILEKALAVDKNRIICVILGPAAKVLIYDLHKNGRVAWDIGHYLKDYDDYQKKTPKTDEAIEKFFKPD